MRIKPAILLLLGIILLIPYIIVSTQGQKWYEEGMTVLLVSWLNVLTLGLMVLGIILLVVSIYMLLKKNT